MRGTVKGAMILVVYVQSPFQYLAQSMYPSKQTHLSDTRRSLGLTKSQMCTTKKKKELIARDTVRSDYYFVWSPWRLVGSGLLDRGNTWFLEKATLLGILHVWLQANVDDQYGNRSVAPLLPTHCHSPNQVKIQTPPKNLNSPFWRTKFAQTFFSLFLPTFFFLKSFP